MEQGDIQRRLAAILAADVAGYTRLMEADEDGTILAWRSSRKEVIDPAIAEHGGRIVKHTGDGFLAEFTTVIAAVRCAVAMQKTLAERNADVPEDRRMEFRIGINMGDIVVTDEDIHGDGVNIAARLEGLADSGGICISGSVFEEVKHKLPLGFEDMGPQEVKNITELIHVYRVRLEPEAAGTMSNGKRPAKRHWQWAALVVVLAVSVGAAAVIGWLRLRAPDVEPGPETPASFPQIARATRHFRVKSPAKLADVDALTIYDRIRDDLAATYRRSGNRYAGVYQTWRRYNVTPYLSATHGRRYVNNYANPRAKAYGKFGAAGTMPEGSVLAKDSFEVTTRGDVVTGPLTLMEKMQRDFNPESRDWRYTMIMPDGSVFGTTKGEGSERVEFCVDCHRAAGDEHDHLFFVPKKHRVHFLEPAAVPR
ncbi:MAG: adenylate/guanylate cyclase domain-containing protein [Rhodospirillales bacterium]